MKLARVLSTLFSLTIVGGATAPHHGEPQTPPPPAHRRALLVGVAKYARGGDPKDEWWDLSSDADVAALRTLLVEKFGFADRDIVTLASRADTTRASILAALDRLIASTEPGDVVYIHYSGHGTQVIDTSGDEFDGLDEALVPSDYVSRHDGSRSIIDDEIAARLRTLGARRPASVLLTFDSCFSGTQTRGGRMIVRGAAYDGPPPPNRAGARGTDSTGLDVSNAAAEGYVVISASRDDQLATQTDDESGGSLGLLTYALLKRLRDAGPQTTYRDLFEGIFDTMTRKNPAQTPQIEGDIDTTLLNGAAAVPEPYVETRVDGDRLVLQEGSLHGVTAGSTFGLYAAGTRSFRGARTQDTAEVESVRATTAVLKTSANLERLRLARAVEIAHKYGDASLRVDVSAVDALPRRSELSARIQELSEKKGLIRAIRDGAWDLKVCGNPCPEEIATAGGQRAGNGVVRLIRQDGSRAADLPDSPDLPEAFSGAIENEARWRMVSGLERKDPNVGVEVRLVAVDATLGGSGKVTAAVPRRSPTPTVNGKPALSPGEYFMVEVRNTGAFDAYVSVLDLSADGSINPIWPHPGIARGAQDNKVRAESTEDPAKAPWRLVPFPYVYQVGPRPAARNEIIKAIATDVPADFTVLLTPQTRGQVSRGEAAAQKTPVGRLLASVTRPSTRGAQQLAAEPPDPTSWSTGSFTFVIPAAPPK